MTDAIIHDLKAHARVLHKRAQALDPSVLTALRALREFSSASDTQLCETLQRRHCLLLVARRTGFRDWEHLLAVLDRAESDDFGTLLYPATCQGHWNIWSAAYEEAREIRAAHGGYLLAYKRQFLIVDRDYVDSMGLDPDDADWSRIGRDWVRPADPSARTRLCRMLVHNTLALQVLRGT